MMASNGPSKIVFLDGKNVIFLLLLFNVARSHVGWRGERNISYKSVKISL